MSDGKNLSLQYELKVLDELVLEKINPERNPIPDQLGSLMGCIDIAKTQKEIIKKKMVGTAYSFSEERHTATYIHNHQARLSHLIERLFNYLDEDIVKKSTDYQLVIDQMISHVVALMRFLADTFKDYFNYDAESTVSFKRTASAHFKEQLTKLKSVISGTPPTVLEVALAPIKEFTHHPSAKPVTFRKLMYFDTMVKTLEPIVVSENWEPKDIKIALVELNFNSNQFLWYIISEIEQIIIPLETHDEKIEKLSFYLKQVNQIQMRNNIILEPTEESIKEKITSWLLEEICYLERSIKPEINYQANIDNPKESNSLVINSNVSVAKFGYILKVLVECRILSEKNLTQMLKLIAEHSTSPESKGKIGYSSLRKKYYYNETGTRKAVKDLIIKMLNEVNKSL
jgi:hypothetical protein